MKKGSQIKLLVLAMAAVGWSSVLAEEVQTLSPVIVTGSVGSTYISPSVEEERKRLKKVAGATNLIEPQKELGLVTLKDALNYQPGLVVQEFFGGLDQPRLNIRGSGIQSNPVNRGVLLMQDGLPLNEADGSFIIGFLEPRNSKFISVRRGANAISPAATTLGGELDFQSFVGSSGDVLRIEGGSFGRFGLQAAKGFETDKMDGRISLTHDKYDGFRHHSDSKRTSVQGNFGFLRDEFENRTYLSYVDVDVTIPTVVPRSMMEENPRWIMGDGPTANGPLNNYKRDPHRRSKQFRAANISHWGTEKLNNTVGIYTQTIDDVFQDPLTNTGTKGMTYGGQYQLAGIYEQLEYRFALDWSRSNMDRNLYTVNKDNGSRKAHFADYDLMAENYNAMAGFIWHMNSDWDLVADAKFTKSTRNAKDRMSGDRLNQSWDYVSPRLGLVWKPVAGQRFYANISRNNEAPTFWEIINDGATSLQDPLPTPMDDTDGTTGLSKLKIQRANTFEIGGDGILGTGEYAPRWDLSYYYSDVKDELISVSNAYGNSAATYNYGGGTKHQGVEFGLSGKLPAPWASSNFDYRLAYTYSDFRFKDGEYAGNRIAGVPVHMISAELLYRVGGLSFGPNVRWMPQKTETTHANTPGTQQDSYALLGFTANYEINDKLDIYVRGDNLTDRNYASAFVIRNNVPINKMTGKPNLNAPTFLPGNGRSVLAGLSYKF